MSHRGASEDSFVPPTPQQESWTDAAAPHGMDTFGNASALACSTYCKADAAGCSCRELKELLSARLGPSACVHVSLELQGQCAAGINLVEL